MSKTLTTNELDWDTRPFSLTLAGCLAIAGMPLASQAVAEVTPELTTNVCPYCDGTVTAEHSDPVKRSQTTEPFHITEEKSANWYLRKLASIDAEKARIKAQTEKIIAELDSDRDGLKFLYESELQEFVRAELTRKGGRKKTLHLIQGTCAFRSVGASLKLADPALAFAHAKENLPAAIETTERLDTEEYRNAAALLYSEFKSILPGMEKTDARESFSVKFGGKSEA